MEYINAFWVGGLIVHWCRYCWRRPSFYPAESWFTGNAQELCWEVLEIYDKLIDLREHGQACLCWDLEIRCFMVCKKGNFGTWFLGVFMGGFTASAVGIAAALTFFLSGKSDF